jgi:CubicO group peptidase (beta-lactamase class C family)
LISLGSSDLELLLH